MFAHRNGSYDSTHSSADSSSYTDSISNSVNATFSSDSSWEPSSPTTSRQSLARLDNRPFAPSIYPDVYGFRDEFSAVSEMAPELYPGFLERSMLFPLDSEKVLIGQSMMGYDNFPTYAAPIYEPFEVQNAPMNEPPDLELDTYSPKQTSRSPRPMDFVVPSQTTFAETYDMHSQMGAARPLDMNSPNSDYTTDSLINSPARSANFSTLSSDDSKSFSITPSKSPQFHQRMFEPLQSSSALQRIQTDGHTLKELRKQKARRNSDMVPVPGHIRVQNRAIKKCRWPGCNGKFQRQEHLKRHEKTHTNSETYMCQFCDKPFGRSDNLKSHTRLHANPSKKSSRTKYFPQARKAYEEMTRKPRKIGDLNTGSSKAQPDTPTTPR